MRARSSTPGLPTAIVLIAAALLFPSCHETSTPTEPGPVGGDLAGQAATLSGVVRDPSGAGLGGVSLTCQRLWAHTSSAAGSVGEFSFPKFPSLVSGRATVEIYQAGEERPTSITFELKPGSNTRDFSVVRYHGEPASISGVVTFSSARPAGEVLVWCQEKSTTVAPDGSYALSGLESGTWGVTATWGVYGEYGLSVVLKPGPNTVDLRVPY